MNAWTSPSPLVRSAGGETAGLLGRKAEEREKGMEVSAVEPIRQVIDDMPEILSVPPEVRHQRVEIVFRLLQQKTVEGSFKEALGAMPDIGDDDDFARPRDFGRGEMQWDI